MLVFQVNLSTSLFGICNKQLIALKAHSMHFIYTAIVCRRFESLLLSTKPQHGDLHFSLFIFFFPNPPPLLATFFWQNRLNEIRDKNKNELMRESFFFLMFRRLQKKKKKKKRKKKKKKIQHTFLYKTLLQDLLSKEQYCCKIHHYSWKETLPPFYRQPPTWSIPSF